MEKHEPIYVEELTYFSLLVVLMCGGWRGNCFYLHQTKRARKFAKSLKHAGLIREVPQVFDFSYAKLKDSSGDQVFEYINEHLVKMASKVGDGIADTFYKKMVLLIDKPRLNLFFYKIVANKMHDTTVFLYAASTKGKGRCVLSSSPWARELKRYGKTIGLNVSIIPSLKHHGILGLVHRISSHRRRNINESKGKQALQAVAVPKATIGVWYAGRTLDKDITKRSEIFWFSKEGPISASDIMLYFERKDIIPPPKGVQVMHDMGIKTVSFYSMDTVTPTPVWQKTGQYANQIKIQVKRVIWAYFWSLLTFKPVPFFFIERMAWFINVYATWYDFFGATGIKLNVYGDFINPGHIAVNQAMRHQGGSNAVYQWSHLHFHSALMSIDTDVLFSFGPTYATYWQLNKSLIGDFVPVGYPWNVQNTQLRQNAQSLRAKIIASGASYIVCYLDENSSDDRFSIITNQRARAIYTFWLKELLNDSTLGIIFKPAYIHDFNKRICEPLKELFEKALSTGRCLIIGDGHYKTDTLPAEVGLASDVTVGLLIAGTAVLESVLAGSKAVFLDLEGLYHEEIYKWGKDSVVFDTCEKLSAAIARYRKDPSQSAGFGDLKDWAYHKDPFHDGNGPNRIAQFINAMVNEKRKVPS